MNQMSVLVFNIFQYFLICLFSTSFIFSNNTLLDKSYSTKDLLSRNKYVTDDKGNILINVNVWGHVKHPGNHLVKDGIDLISLLSVVGGPHPGANMRNIIIIRHSIDENNQTKYKVDLDSFYENGDRNNLVSILPNDTIIIKEKPFRNILNSTNILTSLLQMLNIYLQIQIITS